MKVLFCLIGKWKLFKKKYFFFPSKTNVSSVLSVDLEAIRILKTSVEISFLAAVCVRIP